MRRVNFSFTRTGNVRERGGFSVDIPEGITEEEAQVLVKDAINKNKMSEFLVSERYMDNPVWEIQPL